MVEAEERCALIEDVEEETFVRFVEFMYTNEYAVPDPDLDITSIEEAPTEEAPACEEIPPADEWPTEVIPEPVADPFPEELFISGKKQKTRKKGLATKANRWCEDAEDSLQVNAFDFGGYGKRRDSMWMKFQTEAVSRDRAVWEPRQNVSPSENYTQVFLCHAQLYILSDRYGIGPLRDLCIQKLRLTLSKYTLFEARISDIVELVRYTYDETMGHEQGMDKLRSLVLNYVVCHIETIAKHSAFTEMVQERGVLGKDLVLKMLQRLD